MQLLLQKQRPPHQPASRSLPSPRIFLSRNSGAAKETEEMVLLEPNLTDEETEYEDLRYLPPGHLAEPGLESHVSATISPWSEFGGLPAFLCVQLWAQCVALICQVEG